MPHFSYCNIIWGNTFSSRLKSICILQKKTIHTISLAKYRAHSNPLLKKHNTLTIKDINKYQTSLFMYKVFTASLPPIFTSSFQLNSQIHDHNTRQTNDFHLPTNHSTIFSRRSISYFGAETWNSIPLAILQYPISSNVILKRHLLSAY
jgi:hypothetical protein